MAGSRGGEASAAETVPRVRADASVLRAERRTISLVAAVSSIPLPHDLRPPLQCRDCYVSFMQDSHVRLSGTPPMNLRARFGACRPEERSRQLVIRRRDFRLLPAKLKRTQQTHAPSDGVGCCSRDDTSDSAERPPSVGSLLTRYLLQCAHMTTHGGLLSYSSIAAQASLRAGPASLYRVELFSGGTARRAPGMVAPHD